MLLEKMWPFLPCPAAIWQHSFVGTDLFFLFLSKIPRGTAKNQSGKESGCGLLLFKAGVFCNDRQIKGWCLLNMTHRLVMSLHIMEAALWETVMAPDLPGGNPVTN